MKKLITTVSILTIFIFLCGCSTTPSKNNNTTKEKNNISYVQSKSKEDDIITIPDIYLRHAIKNAIFDITDGSEILSRENVDKITFLRIDRDPKKIISLI